MENVNLKVHNYKLEKKQNKEIQRKMEFLLRQVPFDARISLDFDYKDKVFYGKLKVDLNGKSFFSKDKNVILSSLTGLLCKKVLKQVMKWKKSRTVEEITGIIAFEPRKAEQPLDSYFHKKTG